MYNDVITLVAIVETENEVGDLTQAETKTEVFAEVRSIGMKEKYESLAVGLKPELTFVLADYYDYDNQEFIDYNSIRYRVFRTYMKRTHELEITVTKG